MLRECVTVSYQVDFPAVVPAGGFDRHEVCERDAEGQLRIEAGRTGAGVRRANVQARGDADRHLRHGRRAQKHDGQEQKDLEASKQASRIHVTCWRVNSGQTASHDADDPQAFFDISGSGAA